MICFWHSLFNALNYLWETFVPKVIGHSVLCVCVRISVFYVKKILGIMMYIVFFVSKKKVSVRKTRYLKNKKKF